MILVIDHPRTDGTRYADQYRLFRDDQEREAYAHCRRLGWTDAGPLGVLVGNLIPGSPGVAGVYACGDVSLMVLRLPNP